MFGLPVQKIIPAVELNCATASNMAVGFQHEHNRLNGVVRLHHDFQAQWQFGRFTGNDSGFGRDYRIVEE